MKLHTRKRSNVLRRLLKCFQITVNFLNFFQLNLLTYSRLKTQHSISIIFYALTIDCQELLFEIRKMEYKSKHTYNCQTENIREVAQAIACDVKTGTNC